MTEFRAIRIVLVKSFLFFTLIQSTETLATLDIRAPKKKYFEILECYGIKNLECKFKIDRF